MSLRKHLCLNSSNTSSAKVRLVYIEFISSKTMGVNIQIADNMLVKIPITDMASVKETMAFAGLNEQRLIDCLFH